MYYCASLLRRHPRTEHGSAAAGQGGTSQPYRQGFELVESVSFAAVSRPHRICPTSKVPCWLVGSSSWLGIVSAHTNKLGRVSFASDEHEYFRGGNARRPVGRLGNLDKTPR